MKSLQCVQRIWIEYIGEIGRLMRESSNWCWHWLCTTLKHRVPFHGIVGFALEPPPDALASLFDALFIIAALVVAAVVFYYAN